MTPYTTPTLDTNELTMTIARQITHATHASLDPAEAPTLGGWVRGSSTDDSDWRPTEARKGERPVGWVRVNTRKRGPVLVWCEGWTETRRGYLANIMWPIADMQRLTDGALAELRAQSIDRDASYRASGRTSHGYAERQRAAQAWHMAADATSEQRRRIVESIIRAGSAQEA